MNIIAVMGELIATLNNKSMAWQFSMAPFSQEQYGRAK